jgi:hypothetical protein
MNGAPGGRSHFDCVKHSGFAGDRSVILTRFPAKSVFEMGLMKRLLALPLFLLLGGGVARATVANVSADAHVTSTLPSTNFGGRSNLAVSGTSTAYLRFDLSNLPSGTTSAQVSKATMYVYVNRVYTTGTLSLAPLTAGFAESSVTYNGRLRWGLPRRARQFRRAGCMWRSM